MSPMSCILQGKSSAYWSSVRTRALLSVSVIASSRHRRRATRRASKSHNCHLLAPVQGPTRFSGRSCRRARPGWLAMASTAQRRSDGGKTGRLYAPPHPSPPLLTDEEARLRQDSGVMRDSRLTLLQWTLKIARADLHLRRHQREQSETYWVGQRAEDSSQLYGLIFGERCIHHRCAAQAAIDREGDSLGLATRHRITSDIDRGRYVMQTQYRRT